MKPAYAAAQGCGGILFFCGGCSVQAGIGYKLMTVLGIAALCGPMIAWIAWIAASAGRLDGTGAWSFVGWLGTFLIGIGLFNFVAILLKQYLGHLLSILCFLIGGGLVGLNLVFLL